MQLADALRAMDADDPHVFGIERELGELMSGMPPEGD
jgi:hypothetical protein